MELTFDCLKKSKLAPAAEFECLRAFNILLRILRPSTFGESWPELFSFAWARLLESQSYIERLCNADEIIDVEEIKFEVANVAQTEHEAVYQLDFELFSLISARVSSELTGSNNETMANFMEPVLKNFNEEKW